MRFKQSKSSADTLSTCCAGGQICSQVQHRERGGCSSLQRALDRASRDICIPNSPRCGRSALLLLLRPRRASGARSVGTSTGVQQSRGGREARTLRMCRLRMVARRAHCAEGACRGNLKAIFHVRPLSRAVPVLEIWLRAAEFRHCRARGKGLLLERMDDVRDQAGRTNPTVAPRRRSRIAAHAAMRAPAPPDGGCTCPRLMLAVLLRSSISNLMGETAGGGLIGCDCTMGAALSVHSSLAGPLSGTK